MVKYAKSLGLKTCLYCGRDTGIENWMEVFLVTKENATDRIAYMYSNLKEKFGTEDNSTYTSTRYDSLGIVDFSFDEMIDKIAKETEGIYNIQWKSGGHNITLGLTISVDKEYFEGSVSFAD